MRTERRNAPQTNDSLERAIVNVLERAPQPNISADFARRVTSRLPRQAPARARIQIGPALAVLSAFVIAIVLFAIAPHAVPVFTNMPFMMELLLLTQLATIGYFFTVSRKS